MRLKIKEDCGSRAIILKKAEVDSRIKDTVNRQNFSSSQRTDQISELIFSQLTSERLCELIATIVVLNCFAFMLLISMFVFMKGFIFFYLRIISSFLLVAAHIHVFTQHTHTHTLRQQEKEEALCHVALRYEFRDLLQRSLVSSLFPSAVMS